MPTTLDLAATFDTYAKAWSAHDPDAIIALHSLDTQFWLHSGAQPVQGRPAVREAFAEMFRQWPGFGFEVYRLLLGEQHWVLDWALTAEPTGSDGQPHPIRFDCVDIVTVDADGLVVRKDTFVDAAQVRASLSALA
ncbi:nuclear transport factor 2 family protein [Nocardia sp. CDC153]|uniref:nuclear transport factor 2 family protein n=1 Tax=Nocardia sp. CDC153 TaxID=3112167 RepID=UPI002DB5F8D4|nr:nuclear transport factor 2 family protein [Nocardia sp. CDC153]MEC3956430.1 nuclear transport factor 2 family protein [Nocardia sp. CDC153]